MKRITRTMMLVSAVAVAAAEAFCATPPPPATRPAGEDAALAASILHDVRLGRVPDDVRGHLRRAAVLAEMAIRLQPSAAEPWQVLAETHEKLGDFAAAGAAQDRYLQAIRWRDYDGAVRWLRYQLGDLQTAEARQAMLKKMLADETRSPSVRAMAAVNLAVIEAGRAGPKAAGPLYRQALKLDANEPTALRALRRRQASDDLVGRTRIALAMLRGNPLAINVAWEIGQVYRCQGLHKEALAMYAYAADIAKVTGQKPSRTFRRDHLDATLDAGQDEQAVAGFGELVKEDPLDLASAELLMEAYLRLGKAEQAGRLLGRMAEANRRRELSAVVKAPVAAGLAWFQLRLQRRQATAETWGQKAILLAPDDPVVRRVWAMASLTSGMSKEVGETLNELAGQDAYAAAALASHAFANSDLEGGRKILAAAAKLPRRGAGWRELAAVAASAGVTLPPAGVAEELATLLAAFTRESYLAVVQTPGKVLTVKADAVAATVKPGDVPAVALELSNSGTLPIMLGRWGLMTPEFVIVAELRADGRTVATQKVPVRMAARRYLRPGDSLRKVVRVDAGDIGRALGYRPLGDMELLLRVVPDPIDRDGKLVSALPTLAGPTVRIVRKGLIEGQSPEVYYQALKALVVDLLGADSAKAMRAAEVTVSLLAMIEKVKAGRPTLAGKLTPYLREPELLAMLRHCLNKAPDAVRCRTLGAMGRLQLTDLMVQLMAPCLAHKSPIVRARAVELLGRSAPRRYEGLLKHFIAGDADPLVRAMAERCLPATKKP